MNQNPIKVRSNLRCYSNLNLSTLLLGFINTTQGGMVQLNLESNLTMSVSAADSQLSFVYNSWQNAIFIHLILMACIPVARYRCRTFKRCLLDSCQNLELFEGLSFLQFCW